MTTQTTLNDYREVFSALGLSEDESRLYCELLEHPGTPAGRLAPLASLKRGYTYNLLANLVKKGLVFEAEERGVKRFRAAPPTALLSRLEEKQRAHHKLVQMAGQLVPLLTLLERPTTSMPRVQLYKGTEGVKAVYEDTLTARDGVLLAFADFATTFPRSHHPALNRWIWEYSSRRAAKGIWYHGIVNRSLDSDLAYKRRRAQKRRLKLLGGKPLTVEINVYDDKVAVCSTAADMIGVILRSEPIAESVKQIHRALWEALPEYGL